MKFPYKNSSLYNQFRKQAPQLLSHVTELAPALQAIKAHSFYAAFSDQADASLQQALMTTGVLFL